MNYINKNNRISEINNQKSDLKDRKERLKQSQSRDIPPSAEYQKTLEEIDSKIMALKDELEAIENDPED